MAEVDSYIESLNNLPFVPSQRIQPEGSWLDNVEESPVVEEGVVLECAICYGSHSDVIIF
jgi:hypothetical protein